MLRTKEKVSCFFVLSALLPEEGEEMYLLGVNALPAVLAGA